ncbi:putative membrane protein YgcG [Breznakia sp. PF5-3]|uniref:hypothetical protein n=1 Tax=unclassified Breznakia TaxID=2623764 RepID=UPI002405B2B3|nr:MULTISPECIES: hypothetical protein [unclassified Breznakia]MDF9825191.1 putative membrane protein YgcG [Breznakia sp. PM6-1]MDF9836049.1 putative membrane protein YgcG [Breznakia sp. PF5-3]MDF9838865.1 putative membrane protein YgcG [Breznakia sp. PFB2-8]MDF9860891.1 putative membrane protein YgcG [Breznakia sp. PH5-24]
MKHIMEKIRNLNTKQKIITGVSTVIVIALIVVGVVMTTQSNEPSIEMKKNEFTVEYGETLELPAKNYVKADKEVLDKTEITVDTKNVKLEDHEVTTKISDKDDKSLYLIGLPVGKYAAKAKYEDETLDFKIIVKDTKRPEFIDFKDKIEVDRAYSGDLSKQFQAKDLSEVAITVDVKNVDFSKAGEYKAKVTATDVHKNKTTKEFTVLVKSKTEAERKQEEKKAKEEQKNTENSQQNDDGSTMTWDNGTSSSGASGANDNQNGGQTGGGSQSGGSTGGSSGGDYCSGLVGNSNEWFKSMDELNEYVAEQLLIPDWPWQRFTIWLDPQCGITANWY